MKFKLINSVVSFKAVILLCLPCIAFAENQTVLAAKKGTAAPLKVQTAQIKIEKPVTIDPENKAKLFIDYGKFGVSIYNSLVSYEPTIVGKEPPTFIDKTKVEDDLNNFQKIYAAKMNEANNSASVLSSGLGAAVTTIEVAVATTGIGTVPAIVGGAIARAAIDEVANSVRREGEQRAKALLYDGLQRWQDSSGVSKEDVVARAKAVEKLPLAERAAKYKEVADLYDKATGDITKLRDKFQNDENGYKAATEFLMSTIANSSDEMRRTAYQNARDIGALSADYGNFVKTTTEWKNKTEHRLKQHEDALIALNDDLKMATKDIVNLQKAQNTTSQQVAIMQDILFDQQPAASKVVMLENNLKHGLDKDERDAMIKYYKVQARKEELVADTAKVVNAAKDVANIMNNLGIKDPRINEVVNVASVAQTALSQALIGSPMGYLSALSTVSSMFGGSKPDPVQEQFNRIFGFLQMMDAKLDRIIELQQKTLHAIAELSSQVAELERNMNDRFDRVDFELKMMAGLVRQQMWDKYAVCNTAYSHTAFNGKETFDESSLRFKDTPTLATYVSSYPGEVLPCAFILQGEFGKIRNQKVFGPVLSLSQAITVTTDEIGKSPANKKELEINKTNLEKFLVNIYAPSYDILRSQWYVNKYGHLSNVVALLSTPSADVPQLRERIKALKDKNEGKIELTACGFNDTPSLLSKRLKSLMCYKENGADIAKNPEATALERTDGLMRDAIARDQLDDVLKWTGAVARAFDFSKTGGDDADYYTLKEMVEGNAKVVRGKDLLESALMVTDIAIAQQVMLHGDLMSHFIYDLAWNMDSKSPKKFLTNEELANQPKTDIDRIYSEQSALSLLTTPQVPDRNPWLSRNVTIIALVDAMERKGFGKSNAWIPYRTAMESFEKIKPEAAASKDEKKKNETYLTAGIGMLRSIFDLPNDVTFDTDEFKATDLKYSPKLYINWGGLRLEMPTVEAFRKQALLYPPGLRDTIAKRQVLAEHFADYELLDGNKPTAADGTHLSLDAQERIAKMLIQGLRAAPTK